MYVMYGMVWYGIVSYGMVWYGTVWYGMYVWKIRWNILCMKMEWNMNGVYE